MVQIQQNQTTKMISDAAIAELKQELSQIRARIAEVEPLKAQETAILAYLATLGESPRQPNLFHVQNSRNPERYAGNGVTDGTHRFLLDHPDGTFFTPREIMLGLQEGGLRNGSKNLRTMIANACNRKSKPPNQEYEQGTKDGALAYRLTAIARELASL